MDARSRPTERYKEVVMPHTSRVGEVVTEPLLPGWCRLESRPQSLATNPSITPRSNAYYSFSKPWLVNFSVRLFSVTVRTT